MIGILSRKNTLATELVNLLAFLLVSLDVNWFFWCLFKDLRQRLAALTWT